MIYLDTSAIVKLIRIEPESKALITWLNSRRDPLVASALVEVELPRALRRSQPDVLGAIAGVLARINRVEIAADVRATAAAYQNPCLRSLDAIHLATADVLLASGRHIAAFVTYDQRLAGAAEEAGLPISAPS